MKRHRNCEQGLLVSFVLSLLIAIHWITPTDSLAQSPYLSIGNYLKVSEKRISRTVYEYTYEASITNIGPPAKSVFATVTSLSTHTTVIKETLSFYNVPFMAPTKSTDSFTVRHDRLYPFKWENLSWEFTSELADNLNGTSSLIIPSLGGTISSINAYGDVVTLEIPPNALDSPQTITLTVLDYPTVSPVTDVVFPGVSIEPHGSIVKTPVKLKVVLANQLSNPQLSFLFYLRSPTMVLAIQNQVVTNNSIEGEIIHFSTYAGGALSLSSIAGLITSLHDVEAMIYKTNDKNSFGALDIIDIIDMVSGLEEGAKRLDILGSDKASDYSNAAKGGLQQFALNLLSNPPTTVTPEYAFCLEYLIRLVEKYLGDKDLADRLRSITATTLKVTPSLTYLWPGHKVQLRASMTDFYGREIPVSDVTWSSDKPSVATCTQTQSNETEVTASDQIDCGVAFITAKDVNTDMSATAKIVVCRTQIVGYHKDPSSQPFETTGWRITGDTDTPTIFPDLPSYGVCGLCLPKQTTSQFWQPTGVNRSGIILGNVWRYTPATYTGCPEFQGPIVGYSPYLGQTIGAYENGVIKYNFIGYHWGIMFTGINERNIIVSYWYPPPYSYVCGGIRDVWIIPSIWQLITGDQRHFLHRQTQGFLSRYSDLFTHPPDYFTDWYAAMRYPLPDPPDSPCGWAPTGINDSGKIVGWSWCAQRGYIVDASEYIAAIESGSSLPDLTFTPLCCGVPTGINDVDDIVGYYVEPGTNYNHGFLLKAGSIFPILLPDPPGTVGWTPTGINNCGQIVGHSGYTGYLYDERGFTILSSGIPMAITP